MSQSTLISVGSFSRSSVSLGRSAPYPWILHPAIDLFFCCGGLVWVFFILHYFGFGPENLTKPVQIMLSLAALGAIGLSETHVMATLARVYSGKAKQKFSGQTSLTALACGILAVLGFVYPQFVPIYLKVYLLLVAQHFTAQTFGLTLLYCAKGGYYMDEGQRKSIAFLLQSTMWVAVLRQLCFREWSGTEMLGFKLPFWGALPEWILHLSEVSVAASALVLLAGVFLKWKKERVLMPLPAMLLLLTGVAVFLAGKNITETLWIYVPAFFHGSQYIAVSLALYLKERGLPEGLALNQIGTLVTEPVSLKYLAVLLLAALSFFQLLPYLVGLSGLNSAAFAASFFACIHFHHFLTDRAVWKLRDPELRKLLVS